MWEIRERERERERTTQSRSNFSAQDLSRHTPESHPDSATLKSACTKVKETALFINAEKGKFENLQVRKAERKSGIDDSGRQRDTIGRVSEREATPRDGNRRKRRGREREREREREKRGDYRRRDRERERERAISAFSP